MSFNRELIIGVVIGIALYYLYTRFVAGKGQVNT